MSPEAKKAKKTPSSASSRSANGSMASTLPTVALILGSVLPAALSPSPVTNPPASVAAAAAEKSAKPSKGAPPKEFSIPMKNLTDWAKTVVVTMDSVSIEGHSNVHSLASDCELHFGGHSPNFKGKPEGLVLEPMNVCVAVFPGKTQNNKADWLNFSDQIKDTVVTVSGVPRIWPEHLSGGNEPSNPNHAVEIHPLTSVKTGGQKFDFAPNVFAGEYEGGVKEPTALKIAEKTSVAVTRVGDSVKISFKAGTIGNFTVLDMVIDRDSITSDGAGSFRMNAEVIIDDETSAPVHVVTVKGSAINDEIEKIKKQEEKNVSMQALVLFSLSPEALLEAANQSNGNPVAVETPIQLILYGPPNG
jgi:hypothetical protein